MVNTVPTPLDYRWLPDRDRMRVTTAWILQREPVVIRIAPLIALAVVLAFAVWLTRTSVPVYADVPARVLATDQAAGSLRVSVSSKDAALIVSGQPVRVVVEDSAQQPVQFRGDLAEPMSGGSQVVVDVRGSVAASTVGETDAVTLRVQTGTRSLAAELLSTATRGRGKS
jgi:hypothetical protein